METPEINRKKGNTRSVSVQPFQAECWSCENESGPQQLTTIMTRMLKPRKTSRESKRGLGAMATAAAGELMAGL